MSISSINNFLNTPKDNNNEVRNQHEENNPSIFDIGAEDSEAGDGIVSIGEQKKYLINSILTSTKEFYKKCKFDFLDFIQNYSGFQEIRLNIEDSFKKIQLAIKTATSQLNTAARINNIINCTNEKASSDYDVNTQDEDKGLEFLLEKLKSGNNIILGDGNHTESVQHDFIARNLDKLHDSGVRKIYLEFIRDTENWALNKYYENGDMTDLARLKMDNVDNPESVLALIKLCKEKGIRCYGINNPNGNLISRNEGWANIVKRTNENNEKYILIGGSGHLSTELGENGIDKMLGENVSVLELNNGYKFTDADKEKPNYKQINDNYSVITY